LPNIEEVLLRNQVYSLKNIFFDVPYLATYISLLFNY